MLDFCTKCDGFMVYSSPCHIMHAMLMMRWNLLQTPSLKDLNAYKC